MTLSDKIATQIMRAQLERDEHLIRAAVIDWLPKPLKWLAHHPKLLKLYLALPHKSVLHVYVQNGQIVSIETR